MTGVVFTFFVTQAFFFDAAGGGDGGGGVEMGSFLLRSGLGGGSLGLGGLSSRTDSPLGMTTESVLF